MSYAAAIDQLNAMAPELYARPGQPRRKFSLDEFRALLAALGNPHQRFRSVLIAGTNGKGSTAATLACILTASGARAGLYTSPHLQRVNERIRIGNSEIPDDDFARLFFRVHDVAQQLVQERRLPQHPSFFEILTAQAFLYFAETDVDLAVLEVGMGGRLDATNVVEPLFSIITDISLDHTEWLGTDLAAIAREKVGILHQAGKLITLPQFPEVNQVLNEAAAALGARVIDASSFLPPAGETGPYLVNVLGVPIKIDSPLTGAHQQRNIALAITAAVEISEADAELAVPLALPRGAYISPASIAQGIRNTVWPGRLERIERDGIVWILDVAHNPAGAWAVRSGLASLLSEKHPRCLIFSCLRDKPIAEMAQILFPLFERVILTPLHAARAAAMEDLVAAAQLTHTQFLVAESVAEALRLAKEHAGSGPIVVSGSVYLVGEARSLLLAEGAESGGRAS
ncbi:MAG TPA: folylpolyglutamate synthase/dihydrofolate synthase family protein [Terracidiphilus sp.]|jgi:dihydrofolate synthase/folylpolyglutamate synthase